MGRKVKYSSKEKINAVKEYLDGKDSINSIAKRLDITFQAFKQWVNNYEAMGADAFMTCHNKHYSKAEKEQAVAAYLAGEGSHMDICKKYKIHSTTQLRRWIKKYNGHEELKVSGTGGLTIMTKGRKTSFEERIEIVEYCIAHDHNYTARRIVSFVIRDRNDNALVYDTFDDAIANNPSAHPLCHSDRGFQYTNRVFHNKLENAGMKQSMSRVGKCIDNGPMEGFWGILKRERYYGKHFTSRESLIKMIEEYIVYYNNKRLQRKLGVVTPMEKYTNYLKAA